MVWRRQYPPYSPAHCSLLRSLHIGRTAPNATDTRAVGLVPSEVRMPNGEIAMSFSSSMSTGKYIRAQELATRLAVHRSTLWRWVHDGHLPRPVRLGPNTVAWDCTQIDAWLAERTGGAHGGGA